MTSSLASYYRHAPLGKGLTRRTRKRKARNAERAVIAAVRAACVLRDERCRLDSRWSVSPHGDDIQAAIWYDECDGPSEWAHLHAKRRSKTRGLTPDLRHDTAHTLMLCRAHHATYDAKQLQITALSRKGADGPLRFRRRVSEDQ